MDLLVGRVETTPLAVVPDRNRKIAGPPLRKVPTPEQPKPAATACRCTRLGTAGPHADLPAMADAFFNTCSSQLGIVWSVAALIVATSDTRAQAAPKITEVGFEDGGWVEVANIGDAPADFTGWSIYNAYIAPSRPGATWWPFPAGTILDAGERVVVRWNQARPDTVPSGEIYTGSTTNSFLFGLGANMLLPDSGALALMSTQGNIEVGFPENFVDWVSWGRNDLARQDLAVAAGLWPRAGTARHAIRQPQPSLAIDETQLGEQLTQPGSWFRDATPTPGASNHPGLTAPTSTGFGCEFRVRAPIARLVPVSIPASGNLDFALRLQHDTVLAPGPWVATFIISPFPMDTQLPPPFPSPCKVLVRTTVVVVAPIFEGRASHDFVTNVPPQIAGIPIYAQVAIVHVGFGTSDFALSNRVEFTTGG